MDLQQKGTFETGQEDSTDIPEELKLRLAYREAAVAVLACYFPEPHRPFVEVIDLCSIASSMSVWIHYYFNRVTGCLSFAD